MSPEAKRALITAGRRVAFTGLIILGAWLVLVILRGYATIPWEAVIHGYSEWDWSSSLWDDRLVSEMVGERFGDTLQIVAVGAGFAVLIAALLLVIGVFIRRATSRPGWLVPIRQVLRMVLVSRGASAPIFIGAVFVLVFPQIWWSWSPPSQYDGIAWWPAFFISLLPTWLLVQVGHGEISNWRDGTAGSNWLLVRDVGVRLLITMLRLTGAIIVVTVLIERVYNYAGLGSLFLDALSKRDFPVAFGVAWAFVLMVAFAKLAADLIEIACNHFCRRAGQSEPAEEQTAPQRSIPRVWLFVCLALVVVFVLLAVIGPFFAPYGYNDGFGLTGAARLEPPGGEFILGADQNSRDVFSRLLYGIRLDVQAGAIIAGILMVVAVGWAFLAEAVRRRDGWVGDTLEDLVMLPRDILCAFPWLVLLLLLMTNVGTGLMQVALVSSLVLLPRAVGMMREAYHSPSEGHSWRYSILQSIPVMLLFTVAGGILYVSTTSFLGFGISEPWSELGSMINRGHSYMITAPWLVQWPSISLVLLILVWMMAGETLLERLGFRSKAVWSKVVE